MLDPPNNARPLSSLLPLLLLLCSAKPGTASCAANYHVVAGKCTACPPGATRPAGDDEAGPPTFCTCGANQRVSSQQCIPCQSGWTRPPGDDSAGPDTSCYGPCRVESLLVPVGALVTCPRESTMRHETSCSVRKKGFVCNDAKCVDRVWSLTSCARPVVHHFEVGIAVSFFAIADSRDFLSSVLAMFNASASAVVVDAAKPYLVVTSVTICPMDSSGNVTRELCINSEEYYRRRNFQSKKMKTLNIDAEFTLVETMVFLDLNEVAVAGLEDIDTNKLTTQLENDFTAASTSGYAIIAPPLLTTTQPSTRSPPTPPPIVLTPSPLSATLSLAWVTLDPFSLPMSLETFRQSKEPILESVRTIIHAVRVEVKEVEECVNSTCAGGVAQRHMRTLDITTKVTLRALGVDIEEANVVLRQCTGSSASEYTACRILLEAIQASTNTQQHGTDEGLDTQELLGVTLASFVLMLVIGGGLYLFFLKSKIPHQALGVVEQMEEMAPYAQSDNRDEVSERDHDDSREPYGEQTTDEPPRLPYSGSVMEYRPTPHHRPSDDVQFESPRESGSPSSIGPKQPVYGPMPPPVYGPDLPQVPNGTPGTQLHNNDYLNANPEEFGHLVTLGTEGGTPSVNPNAVDQELSQVQLELDDDDDETSKTFHSPKHEDRGCLGLPPLPPPPTQQSTSQSPTFASPLS